MRSFSGVHTVLMIEDSKSYFTFHFKVDGKQLVGFAHPNSSAFKAARVLYKYGIMDDSFSILRKTFLISGKIDDSRKIREFSIESDPASPSFELDELLVAQIMEV